MATVGQVLRYNPTTCSAQQFQGYGGTGSPGSAAPPSWYSAVAHGLASAAGALSGRCVVVNAMGSYLFAAQGAGIGPTGAFDGLPTTVAALVASGYVWIDACGLPMTARWVNPGVPTTGFCGGWLPQTTPLVGSVYADGSGIAAALGAMGWSSSQLADGPLSSYPAPYAPSGTDLSVYQGSGGYPYPTALVLNTAPDSLPQGVVLPYQVGNFPLAPIGTGRYLDYPQWAYSMLAVRWGRGLYVYCTQLDGQGVSPATCVGFVTRILSREASIPSPCAATPAPVPPGSPVVRDLLIAGGVVAGVLVLIAGVRFLEAYTIARAGRSQIQILPGSTLVTGGGG